MKRNESETCTVQKIKFKGQDYILTDPDERNSPISTLEAYQKGEVSYAHYYGDTGEVYRYQKLIGTEIDIEIGKRIEIEIDMGEFADGLAV